MDYKAFRPMMFALTIDPTNLLDGTSLHVAVRLLLAMVMLSSGIGKLHDLRGTRQALGDFGVPSRWVKGLGWILPWTEVALSMAIMVDGLQRLAALGMCLLFLAFTGGIANLLRQDKAPPCHCFGAIHSAPVTKVTLLRSASLALLAVAFFQATPRPLTPNLWWSALVGFCFAAAAYAFRKAAVARMNEALKRLEGLRTGQRIPAVRLSDGRWLEQLLNQYEKSVVVLTTDKCGSCAQLKEPLARWTRTLSGDLNIVTLIHESVNQELRTNEFSLNSTDFNSFLSFRPGAFLVDNSGTILSPPVSGPLEIEALIRTNLPSY